MMPHIAAIEVPRKILALVFGKGYPCGKVFKSRCAGCEWSMDRHIPKAENVIRGIKKVSILYCPLPFCLNHIYGKSK